MVYVDDFKAPFGRLVLSHMYADTKEELLQMADQVGVARKWIQNEDTPREHFDICQAKRAKAIALGAVVISRREMVMLRKKKEALVTDSHFNA